MQKVLLSMVFMGFIITEEKASDNKVMDYAMVFATAKEAARACGDIDFDEAGAGAALKAMDFTRDEMQTLVEYFYVTKPYASKQLASDGADRFCRNAMQLLGPEGTSAFRMLKYKH
jgi:hypothetical protein